ncbi:MAG: hypothetical protein ACI4NG_04735 [Candidatus Gallimonas sp.]
MKKLVVKTALVTLGATILLLGLFFGISAACSPAAMMRLTAAFGMDEASGRYAYDVYVQSGDLSCLAYACEIAIAHKSDDAAIERLDALFKEDAFAEICASRDGDLSEYNSAQESAGSGISVSGGYDQYLYGGYACALYRLGRAEEASAFAIGKTGAEFSANNASVALALEAVQNKDKQFCAEFARSLSASAARENEDCKKFIQILEDFANE